MFQVGAKYLLDLIGNVTGVHPFKDKKLNLPLTIYTSLLFIAMFYFYWFSTSIQQYAGSTMMDQINTFISKLNSHIQVIAVGLCMFKPIIYRTTYIALSKSLERISYDISSLGLQIRESPKEFYWLLMLILIKSFIAITEYLKDAFDESVLFECCSYIILMTNQSRFQAVASELTSYFKALGEPTQDTSKLLTIERIHCRLETAVDHLNQVYSHQLLSLVAFYYLNATVYTFYIFFFLTFKGLSVYVTLEVAAVALCLVQLVRLTSRTTQLKNSVLDFGRMLCDIMTSEEWDVGSKNRKTSDQAKLKLYFTKSEEVNITACGLFKIDNALILPVSKHFSSQDIA